MPEAPARAVATPAAQRVVMGVAATVALEPLVVLEVVAMGVVAMGVSQVPAGAMLALGVAMPAPVAETRALVMLALETPVLLETPALAAVVETLVPVAVAETLAPAALLGRRALPAVQLVAVQDLVVPVPAGSQAPAPPVVAACVATDLAAPLGTSWRLKVLASRTRYPLNANRPPKPGQAGYAGPVSDSLKSSYSLSAWTTAGA